MMSNQKIERKEDQDQGKGSLHRTGIAKWKSAIPAFVIMVGIFLFSCQNASQSGAESTHITEKVLQFLQHAPANIQVWAKTVDFEWVEFLIRKLAHLTEYAILGAAICYHFVSQSKENPKSNWKRQMIASVIVGACYAGTDEFHQLFVPGRSGQLRDVGIDTIGVLIGTGIFLACIYRKNRRAAKK